MTPYRTARERAAQTSAAAAIARALAHTRQASDQDDEHSYITPARARQIRLQIEEDQRHDH